MLDRTLIKLPKRFFRDHVERDLPTPQVISETAQHFIVDRDDPAMPELLDDAKHYATGGTDQSGNLHLAAAATIAAWERQTRAA